MRNLPSTNALRALEAVVRHGRFTKAADELCLTHGAVSKQIRQLEEIYGTKLLHRETNEVRLTARGKAIYKYVVEALELLDATLDERQSGRVEGILHLSLPPAFSAHWLLPRLSDFTQKYPHVSLKVNTTPDSRKPPDEDVDIAVRFGEPLWQDREVILLKHVYLFPVCRPEFLQGDHPITKIADLKRYSLLHEDDGTLWAKWLTANRGKIDDAMSPHYIPDVHDLLVAAREGLGIALGDNVTAEHYLRSGALVRPFKKAIQAPFSYYLITKKQDVLPPKASAFINWLQEIV